MYKNCSPAISHNIPVLAAVLSSSSDLIYKWQNTCEYPIINNPTYESHISRSDLDKSVK